MSLHARVFTPPMAESVAKLALGVCRASLELQRQATIRWQFAALLLGWVVLALLAVIGFHCYEIHPEIFR